MGPEKSDFQQEIILCAAIHMDDSSPYDEQPINIETGIVVCGRRHNNCMAVYMGLTNRLLNEFPIIMGFITNKDRFVDRKEAYKIAVAANQISDKKHDTGIVLNINGEDRCLDDIDDDILISEDLY